MFSGNWTIQYSKVTNEKQAYYENKKLPNRPDDYGNITIEINHGNLTPFWSLNHKGEYYLDRVNQKSRLYTGRTLQDVGITFPVMNGKAKMTFTGKNITNKHTFDTIGMPLPGRSYSVDISYSL